MNDTEFAANLTRHFPPRRYPRDLPYRERGRPVLQPSLRIVTLGDPAPLYAPLQRVLSGSPACISNCQQGRKACPTPDSCRLPDEPGVDPSWAALTWGEIVAMIPALWPILLVAGCALVAHVLAALP